MANQIFSLARTAMFDAAGNLIRQWLLFFQSLATTLFTMPAAGAVQRSIYDKLAEFISVKDFGAVGDGVTDDTLAIQTAISWAQQNRVALLFPPALYAISGNGLTISGSGFSMFSPSGLGLGVATLVYSGSGTALTIKGSTRLFGVSLGNIAVLVASGVTCQYCIDCSDVSGGVWTGITAGTQGTGKASGALIRFTDSGLIDLYRLTLSYATYTAATIGVLFNDFGSFGNDQIHVYGADISSLASAWSFRCLAAGLVTGAYHENCDAFILIDNTAAWSASSAISNVTFDNCRFNTSGAGPASKKVLQATSTTGNLMTVSNFVLRSCSLFLAGGGSQPINCNLSSLGAGSVFRLTLDTCETEGCSVSLATANNSAAQLIFRGNRTTDLSGQGNNVPDFEGTGTVQSTQPTDIGQYPMLWHDPTGGIVLAGSTQASMPRPPAGYFGRGVLYGASAEGGDPYNSDGLLRLGAGGGLPVQPLSYTSISATSAANPAVITTTGVPITGTYVELSGYTGNWAPLNGAWPITKLSATTFSVAIDSTAFIGALGSPVWRTCQGTTPTANAWIDISGASGLADMDKQIVAFIGGTEYVRLDGHNLYVKISNVPLRLTSLAGAGSQLVVADNNGQLGLLAGVSGTITIPKLTAGGTNGSITVVDGAVTAFTNPT